jgi:hypothetical protein
MQSLTLLILIHRSSALLMARLFNIWLFPRFQY